MELKEIVAKNLIELRKITGITQLELAEKLNYSDKAVSKWERGESLPDVETFKKIADLYGVTVDCLLHEHSDIKKHIKSNGLVLGQKILISIISAALVWVIATCVYAVLRWCGIDPHYASYSFIVALPIMMVVLLIFNSLWGKVWLSLVFVSAIIWTVALCIYFLLPVEVIRSLCFIVPIPIQIAFIFFYGLKILNISLKRKNKEKNKSAENINENL